MRRRKPRGMETFVAMVAGQSPDRHRSVGWPIDRRTRLSDAAAGRVRQYCKASDVGKLALIGRHAERGVSLQMLDGLKALALGELHIRGRDIMLEVDKRFAFGLHVP